LKKKIAFLALSIFLLISTSIACSEPKAAETTLPTTVPSIVPTTKPSPIPEATTTKPASFIFIDSLGRQVEIPSNVTRVALSGPLTQIVLFALCPDKLVGLASQWDSSAKEFLDKRYYELPMLGQLYGGKGILNLETIVASGAQLIVDVGETKANMIADMDSLQKQLNIPTVHIDAYTNGMGDAYRRLGKLLDMEKEAEVLAKYCDEIYVKTTGILSKVGEVGKVRLLYCSGDTGINVIAQGSYHAEVIDLLANNLAIVNNPSGKGTGNEVDLEQIMLWNPDVILFAPGSIYSSVGSNQDWADINAIKNKRYYEVPYGPFNWMGFPPSVQRYLGMIWLAQILYPDVAEYNVYHEVSRYFQLFYHCGITEEQYNRMVANSLGGK
jgi:iron complex transport system substrate-binding protein